MWGDVSPISLQISNPTFPSAGCRFHLHIFPKLQTQQFKCLKSIILLFKSSFPFGFPYFCQLNSDPQGLLGSSHGHCPGPSVWVGQKPLLRRGWHLPTHHLLTVVLPPLSLTAWIAKNANWHLYIVSFFFTKACLVFPSYSRLSTSWRRRPHNLSVELWVP